MTDNQIQPPLVREAFPLIGPDETPVKTIVFGHAEWQTHIGGSFLGPEEKDGIAQNWVGLGRCWCILPNLKPGLDYVVRLEAAPLAPYGSELQEITVLSHEGQPVCHRIFPVSTSSIAKFFQLQSDNKSFEFRWRRLDAPTLTVTANSLLMGRLVFQTRPDLQNFDLLLRRDLVQPNTILEFEPNYAISPLSLEDSADARTISFRFFRLLLFEVP